MSKGRKRNKNFQIRFSIEEYQALKERVPFGECLSSWARRILLGEKVPRRKVPTCSPELLKAVNKIGGNLNQLVKKINFSGAISRTQRVELLSFIEQLRGELRLLISEKPDYLKSKKGDTQNKESDLDRLPPLPEVK